LWGFRLLTHHTQPSGVRTHPAVAETLLERAYSIAEIPSCQTRTSGQSLDSSSREPHRQIQCLLALGPKTHCLLASTTGAEFRLRHPNTINRGILPDRWNSARNRATQLATRSKKSQLVPQSRFDAGVALKFKRRATPASKHRVSAPHRIGSNWFSRRWRPGCFENGRHFIASRLLLSSASLVKS